MHNLSVEELLRFKGTDHLSKLPNNKSLSKIWLHRSATSFKDNLPKRPFDHSVFLLQVAWKKREKPPAGFDIILWTSKEAAQKYLCWDLLRGSVRLNRDHTEHQAFSTTPHYVYQCSFSKRFYPKDFTSDSLTLCWVHEGKCGIHHQEHFNN